MTPQICRADGKLLLKGSGKGELSFFCL
jgi:hypothetical protein